MFSEGVREIGIIEAYYNDKLVGKFVDMHTLRNQLGVLADKVSVKFNTINEKSHNTLFWTIIRNGYEKVK
jgi:hypothetical protein